MHDHDRAITAGGVSATAGVALLTIDTWLHPMSADPNAPRAAFAEYAADRLWVGSHLLQLFGVGLASMLSLVMGIVVTLYGIAMRSDPRFGSGLAWTGIAGGVPTACAGVVMACTGFSDATMILNMPANALLLLWMLAVARRLSRLARDGQTRQPA